MRVIAGSARGRALLGARGGRTRPIADRVKASVFDILAPRLEGATCLDLFAGTGAIGIEALSRGAAGAIFVESDRRMAQLIRRNLENCGLAASARVVCADVRRAARSMARRGERFDLVFVDPPYGLGLAPVALSLVSEGGIVREGGIVVVRHERKQEMPASCSNVMLVRQERYGDTVVSFYRCDGGGASRDGGGDRPGGRGIPG